MRAAVVERYGPPSVVSVRTWPDPQPGRGEVLVRVGAASVNSGDARIRGARFPRGFGLPARVALGIRGPRQPVLGVAFAGTVSAVGEGVSGLRIGDRVAGMNGARMGAHAELLAVRADRAVPIPEGVSDADAAGALFGGTTAMHFLRDLVGPGTSVLVNGSSGSVGSAAVQLARAAGGTVTAVTRDENAPLARRLGASATVDYTRTQVAELTERYDVVLDTVGNIDIATGTGCSRTAEPCCSQSPGSARLSAPAGGCAPAVRRSDRTISRTCSPWSLPAASIHSPRSSAGWMPWPPRTGASTPAARPATWWSSPRGEPLPHAAAHTCAAPSRIRYIDQWRGCRNLPRNRDDDAFQSRESTAPPPSSTTRVAAAPSSSSTETAPARPDGRARIVIDPEPRPSMRAATARARPSLIG